MQKPKDKRRVFRYSDAVLRTLPELDHSFITKGPELASEDKTCNELAKIFRGTYQGTAVFIKEFYRVAGKEFVLELESTAMIVYKGSKFFLHCIGYVSKERWLVFAADNIDGSLSQILQNTKKPLTAVQIFRFLYDVARHVETMANNPREGAMQIFRGAATPTNGVVMMHRDLRLENIVVTRNWKDPVPLPHKLAADLNHLAPVALVGHNGCQTTKSQSFRANSAVDLYNLPPNCVDNQGEYDPSSDVWRFGLLCYEMWTQTPLSKHTSVDIERIVVQRFKPKKDPTMAYIYNTYWMGETHLAAPPLLYELVQVGIWQLFYNKRPSPAVVTKCMQWLLEDALIAEGRLPRRDAKLPKSDNPAAVMLHLGYDLPPVHMMSTIPPCRVSWDEADATEEELYRHLSELQNGDGTDSFDRAVWALGELLAPFMQQSDNFMPTVVAKIVAEYRFQVPDSAMRLREARRS